MGRRVRPPIQEVLMISIDKEDLKNLLTVAYTMGKEDDTYGGFADWLHNVLKKRGVSL